MVWGIIGALDEEIALLKASMSIEKEMSVYGFTYYHGVLEGQKVVVVCCSVGKINAALCASVMVREMGADVVVNVGIAGGMDKKLKVLDMVISSEAIHHDCDPIIEKFYPFALSYKADDRLVKLASLACEKLDKKPAYYVGRVATGDVFVEGGAVKERIERDFAPLCVEMEGAAIAQACFMNEKPFLIIRTMSDNADDSASMTYDEFKPFAADQSAKLIIEMLKESSKFFN
ncbi:MAG: 5'-methylthioadenosine/adenosylhomocysteine nucleosidase [Oscillospiraceae bacterium]|nr:5'-methylthioadenosine/adenosylhomocysteine nucleosidase [Oscillospiraceae bacterium]